MNRRQTQGPQVGDTWSKVDASALLIGLTLARAEGPLREAAMAIRLIRRAAGGAALAVREAMQVFEGKAGDGEGKAKA